MRWLFVRAPGSDRGNGQVAVFCVTSPENAAPVPIMRHGPGGRVPCRAPGSRAFLRPTREPSTNSVDVKIKYYLIDYTGPSAQVRRKSRGKITGHPHLVRRSPPAVLVHATSPERPVIGIIDGYYRAARSSQSEGKRRVAKATAGANNLLYERGASVRICS